LPLALFLVFGICAMFTRAWLSAFLDDRALAFSRLPGFELWEMLVALQLASWAWAIPPGLTLLRKHRDAGRAIRPVTAGAVLVALMIVPFVYLVFNDTMKLPLNWAPVRLGVLWVAGAIVDSILLLVLMRAGLAARHLSTEVRSGQLNVADGLRRLTELRSDLQVILTWTGLILSLAVLATAALYHLTAQFSDKSQVGISWTRENVIGFGVYNSATLTLAYAPALASVQMLAAALRERLCPWPTPQTELLVQRGWLKEWQELGKELQTELDVPVALSRFAPIVAPVLSGVLSLAGLEK
jgi:hypothetical protein